MITQKELKKLLHYDLDTGVFTKLTRAANHSNIGDKLKTITWAGYTSVCLSGRKYQAHRLAWLYVMGSWPKEQIDHINHIRSDNRWVNLREVNHQDNHKNISLQKNNRSGVNGVHYDKKTKKWRAYFHRNQRFIGLGRFTDKFEAICARLSANNKYGFHANHGR